MSVISFLYLLLVLRGRAGERPDSEVDFYTFANENLSLQKLADRLNRLRIPTPRGGDRWHASTLGIMLRNEAYIGKMYQFRKYRIEPKIRLKPSAKSKKTSTALRPKEEWIPVEVVSLIPIELFERVQRKLRMNAELSRRNTKRDYLLSGLLYCSQCGGRMGGHTIHSIPYYRCYRKGNPDSVPLSADGWTPARRSLDQENFQPPLKS